MVESGKTDFAFELILKKSAHVDEGSKGRNCIYPNTFLLPEIHLCWVKV